MDDEIKRKLDVIEKEIKTNSQMILDLKAMATAEIEYVKIIKDMEAKELKDIETIHGLENRELERIRTPRIHNTVTDWKVAIWDACPQKILVDSKKMVIFNCKMLGSICCFEKCPRNIDDKES